MKKSSQKKKRTTRARIHFSVALFVFLFRDTERFKIFLTKREKEESGDDKVYRRSISKVIFK